MHVRCPHCYNPIELLADAALAEILCPSCGSSFSVVEAGTTTYDPRGKMIGHFELVQQVGIGSFGSVWKARDTELDRTVALKIPRKDQLNAEEMEKFLREARAAAQLRHPYIVSVHEVGRDNGLVYIVSDFVNGATLSEWIEGKSLTVHEAAGLCVKIADALQHAHEAGVIHRDLKPSNIIVDFDGEPHLTDFGLAKREAAEITMTIEGEMVGTPAYMSPEQARGEGHNADRRSDVYALGVILFRLLTGELPFRGNPRMLVVQILKDDPPSPRKLNGTIPRDLETICLKCLQKEPAQRYQTATELAQDLRRFLHAEPIQARPVSRMARAARWCRRNPLAASLIGAVAGALLIGLVVSSYFAIRLGISNRETKQALAEALLANSRFLRQSRPEGYGVEVRRILEQILELGPGVADPALVRDEAVGMMGDFVALPPIDLNGFKGEVTAIGWHPAGRYLALGFADGAIQFITPEERTDSVALAGRAGTVLSVAFDAAGERVVAVHQGAEGQPAVAVRWEGTENAPWKQHSEFSLGEAWDFARIEHDARWLVAWTTTAVSVWDVDAGRQVAAFRDEELQLVEHSEQPSHDGSISNAALTPDGRLLAVSYDYTEPGFNERGFVVWDLEQRTRAAREPLNLGGQQPHASSFSGNGRFFVYGSDETLLLYEVPGFRQKARWRQDAIRAVDFSPDSQFLTAADIRGVVRLMAVSSGEETARLSHRIPRQTLHRWLLFSGDQQYLADSHLDEVRIWRVGGAREKRLLAGHDAAIPTIDVQPQGKLLATGSKDQTVRVWNARNGQEVFRLALEGPVQSVRFSPDGNLLAVAIWGGEDRDALIYDVNTRKLVVRADHDLEHIMRLVFIDEHHLAASGSAGVAIWDLRQRDAAGGDNGAGRAAGEAPRLAPVKALDGSTCRDIAASRDGTLLAWSDQPAQSPQIQVWRWRDENAAPRLLNAPPMLQGWHGLAFSPEGEDLLFIRETGRAVRWKITDERLVIAIGDEGQFQAPHIALSPNGRWLAALHQQDAVSIWDAETGERVFAFRPERAAIWSLAWSTDSSRLLLGLNDGGLMLWDLAAVNETLAAFGHVKVTGIDLGQ